MSKQYLEAHTFLKTLRDKGVPYTETLVNLMQYAVIEEVAPVVHAEWKVNEHIELDFCSNCLEPVRRYVTAGQMDRSNYKGETFWNYCPHCGAKMDGKEGKE